MGSGRTPEGEVGGETVSQPGGAVRPRADESDSPPGLDSLPELEPGRYVVVGERGRGGLGRVLEVRDRRLGRSVALKELHRLDAGAMRRFVREALITARLSHPSIIPVYEVGRLAPDQPVYVMKFVAGRTLDRVIADASSAAGRLALLPHVIAIAEAIAYAHSRGVVHRDLKPTNVLVGEFGEIVVVDWGLAKVLGDPEPDTDGIDDTVTVADGSGDTMTRVGVVLGTPAYMPPEQARGETVDRRADVYALGALMVHVLGGAPPYRGPDALDQVKAGPPPPLVDVAPDLAAIVAKAMARSAGDRYPSAAEMAEDLKRFQTGRLVQAHSYSLRTLVSRWVARHRTAVVVAAAFTVALAVTTIVAVRNVVAERNAAVAARRLADETAARLAQSNDALLLEATRSSLPVDPTATLAWLKRYVDGGRDLVEARRLAAEAQAAGAARFVLRGHERQISMLAVTSDGRHAVSGSFDHAVRLWDLATGKGRLLGELDDLVLSLSVSADGRFVAAAAKTPVIHLWELPAGTLRLVAVPAERLVNLAFLPDGTLVTAALDGTVRVGAPRSGTWRTIGRCPAWCELRVSPDGKQVASFDEGDQVKIFAVQGGPELTLTGGKTLTYAPDGSFLVGGGSDGVVRIWHMPDGRLERELRGHRGDILSVAVAPDGGRVASGGTDRTARVWDRATGVDLILSGHSAAVTRVAFSPGGEVLASASGDGTVRVWPRSGEARVLRGHAAAIDQLAFTSDGKSLVTGGEDASVRVWPSELDVERTFAGHTTWLGDISFSPDGRTIATPSLDKSVRLWDVASGGGRVLGTHTYPAANTVFAPDGRRLLSNGGELRLWDVTSGVSRILGAAPPIFLRPEITAGGVIAAGRWNGDIEWFDLRDDSHGVLRGHSGFVWSVALTRDGARIFSGGKEGEVREWDRVAGTATTLAKEETSVMKVRLSPDERLLAWGTRDGRVRLLERGGKIRDLTAHTALVHDVRFSTDGRTIATPSEDGTVGLHDVAGGGHHLLVHGDGGVLTAVFSPDGKLVATAGNSLRVWDRATGRLLAVRHGPQPPSYAAFSPDGATLAYGGEDALVHLWTFARSILPAGDAQLAAWLAAQTSATIDGQRPTSPPP